MNKKIIFALVERLGEAVRYTEMELIRFFQLSIRMPIKSEGLVQPIECQVIQTIVELAPKNFGAMMRALVNLLENIVQKVWGLQFTDDKV